MNQIIRAAFLDAILVGRPAELAEAREEEFRRQADRIATRKEKAEAEQFDAGDILTVAIVAGATAIQIEQLSERTDLHQQLVIEALQENRLAIDASQEDLDRLLDQAHVLEDGRRVFETRDGTAVIDEYGNKVADDIITPGEVDDTRPDAETYLARRDAHIALMKEQTDLLAYQRELDRFDQAIAAGNLSQDDVARMQDFMDTQAPAAIRAKLPASDPASQGPSASLSPTEPQATAIQDGLMTKAEFDPSSLFK
ncbi:MAG: hypothetical protein NXH97_22325 [Rhodobacteraceae bacterium]|nr:hypothetical protein [Paracoccaceae bacterium]